MARKGPHGPANHSRQRRCSAGKGVEPDFAHAVRRHRMLDAIARASETGQRQKVAL